MRKPRNIPQADWDAVDIPEATADDFARARPFSEVHPKLFESWKRTRGRPAIAKPKMHIGFRLDADIVAAIKATGRGYNPRIEKVLRDALARGKLRAKLPEKPGAPKRRAAAR